MVTVAEPAYRVAERFHWSIADLSKHFEVLVIAGNFWRRMLRIAFGLRKACGLQLSQEKVAEIGELIHCRLANKLQL